MQLSDFILGLWRIDSWENSSQENLKLFEQCIESGIDTFDQANIYGHNPSCESLFGKSLAITPSFREQIKIISKFNICAHELESHQVKHYDSSYSNAIASVDLSLRRMQTDRLDLLLLHRADYLLNVDEVAKAFQTLKNQGKVLEFGVSNFSTSQFSLLQSRLDFPLRTNQVECNPLRFSCLENGVVDQCQQLNIRPMFWSPLAGGKLFTHPMNEQTHRVYTCLKALSEELNLDIDQTVMAWLKRHPSNPYIILGSSQIERLRSAVESYKIKLTAEQWYRVWTASKGYEVP